MADDVEQTYRELSTAVYHSMPPARWNGNVQLLPTRMGTSLFSLQNEG